MVTRENVVTESKRKKIPKENEKCIEKGEGGQVKSASEQQRKGRREKELARWRKRDLVLCVKFKSNLKTKIKEGEGNLKTQQNTEKGTERGSKGEKGRKGDMRVACQGLGNKQIAVEHNGMKKGTQLRVTVQKNKIKGNYPFVNCELTVAHMCTISIQFKYVQCLYFITTLYYEYMVFYVFIQGNYLL